VPGQRFGRGVVIRETRVPRGDRRGNIGARAALLACDCGGGDYVARLADLIHARVVSCGCGHRGGASRIHGLSSHPLYMTWHNMLQRCENPANKDYRCYGARGIRVCDRWHDVAVFIADIERWLGPRPGGYSFDRIMNGHDYRLDNVQWSSAQQQALNRRRSAWYDRAQRERRAA